MASCVKSVPMPPNTNSVIARACRAAAVCFLPVLFPVLQLFGQEIETPLPQPRIGVTAALSKPTYAPGDTVLVVLQITIPDKYHLFDNPKGPGIGKPMMYAVAGPKEIAWLDLLKTKSKKYKAEVGGWYKGFEGEVCFFLRGIVNRNAADGAYKSTLYISGLICNVACHPVDKNIDMTIPVNAGSPVQQPFENDARIAALLARSKISQELAAPVAADTAASFLGGISLGPDIAGTAAAGTVPAWDYAPQEAGTDLNIWAAIFFAFLAGIILNAMPCVLPVLGVKILSFAQGQGLGRKKAILHSLSFSVGVISVFLLLAALASFANYSWGRQFQDPRALIAIITLIVVFALGMFDVYMITVPPSVSNLDGKADRHGVMGDFLKGVFATVLATPCSGPFLGAVLAWSVLQPPHVIFIVYTSIGAGMSFPYLLLSINRRLAKMLPKPGPWMDDFKKIMGFLLLGFGAYLMLGLPDDYVIPAVLFCVTMSLAVTVYGRFAPWGSSIGRKAMSLIAAIIIGAAGFYLSFMVVFPSFSEAEAEKAVKEDAVWQEFNADSLLKANAQGRNAIVDFTANWCMNCQYNTIMVLTKKPVTDLIKRKNVLAMVADLTMPDPVQDSLLHSLGSRSIPFLALFPGDNPKEPVVMRDVLTKGRVIKALKDLR